MKRFIQLTCIFLLAVFTAHGQSTIAKLKFEEAEEAYSKNDFTTALVKLDDAQKILGSTNPRILYLRIMAQSNIIQNSSFDFQMLQNARENCDFYLKEYETNENIEEKFREVYKVSESLKKYPVDRASFELFMQKRELEMSKKKAEHKALSGVLEFAENLSKQYNFKPGITRQAYVSSNANALNAANISTVTPYEGFTHYSRKIGTSVAAVLAEGHAGYSVDANDKVVTCGYYVQSSKNDPASSEAAYNYYYGMVKDLVGSGLVDFRQKDTGFSKIKSIIVTVPSQENPQTVSYYITVTHSAYNKFTSVYLSFSTLRKFGYFNYE